MPLYGAEGRRGGRIWRERARISGCGGGRQRRRSDRLNCRRACSRCSTAPERLSQSRFTALAPTRAGQSRRGSSRPARAAFRWRRSSRRRAPFSPTFRRRSARRRRVSRSATMLGGRHGVCLADLGEDQRNAALGLMRESLSAAGYQLARDIMRLNEHALEITGKPEEYSEWFYWVSIFGTPSPDEPWGFQLDGHHLNLNVFVLGEQLVMTPTFMGRSRSWRALANTRGRGPSPLRRKQATR